MNLGLFNKKVTKFIIDAIFTGMANPLVFVTELYLINLSTLSPGISLNHFSE